LVQVDLQIPSAGDHCSPVVTTIQSMPAFDEAARPRRLQSLMQNGFEARQKGYMDAPEEKSSF
jgi:hypothetical protein